MLFELMLADARISHKQITGFGSNEFTHSAVAAFIASGMADVGFGVKTAAHHFGLDFIPLVRERYFFAMPATALSDPPGAWRDRYSCNPPLAAKQSMICRVTTAPTPARFKPWPKHLRTPEPTCNQGARSGCRSSFSCKNLTHSRTLAEFFNCNGYTAHKSAS